MGTPTTSAEVDVARGQYFLSIQMVLADFQYIEESLRMFLTAAYDFVRAKTNGRLPFKYDYEDVENDAMGRLLRKFSNFSNSEALVKTLTRLLKHRNTIAHRGLLLTYEEQNDVKYLDAQTKKLDALHNELKPCLQALLDQRSALTKREAGCYLVPVNGAQAVPSNSQK